VHQILLFICMLKWAKGDAQPVSFFKLKYLGVYYIDSTNTWVYAIAVGT